MFYLQVLGGWRDTGFARAVMNQMGAYLREFFGHLEHVYGFALQNFLKSSITHNQAFIRRILQLVFFNVCPDALGDFGTRHHLRSKKVSEIGGQMNISTKASYVVV